MRKHHDIKTKHVHNCNTQLSGARVGHKPILDVSTVRGDQNTWQNIT